MYGAQLGIWAAITLHCLIREELLAHLSRLLTLQDTDISKYVWKNVALTFATYAIMIGNYAAFEPENKAEWSTRIEAQCGADELKEAFQLHSVKDFGESNIGLFLYFGLLYSLKTDPDVATNSAEASWSDFWANLLVYAILIVPVMLFNALSDFSGQSEYVQLLFGNFLLFAYLLFVNIGLTETVSKSLGLVSASNQRAQKHLRTWLDQKLFSKS